MSQSNSTYEPTVPNGQRPNKRRYIVFVVTVPLNQLPNSLDQLELKGPYTLTCDEVPKFLAVYDNVESTPFALAV